MATVFKNLKENSETMLTSPREIIQHNQPRDVVITKLLNLCKPDDLGSEVLKQELANAFNQVNTTSNQRIWALDQKRYPNRWGFDVQFDSLTQCIRFKL